MSEESNNKSIEEIFEGSWDGALTNYHMRILHGKATWLIPMDHLIHQLRLQGFDKLFRAGIQMDEFVLSRSRKWGLKEGQATIRFELLRTGQFRVRQCDLGNSEPFILRDGEITDDVEDLLEKLLSQPID